MIQIIHARDVDICLPCFFHVFPRFFQGFSNVVPCFCSHVFPCFFHVLPWIFQCFFIGFAMFFHGFSNVFLETLRRKSPMMFSGCRSSLRASKSGVPGRLVTPRIRGFIYGITWFIYSYIYICIYVYMYIYIYIVTVVCVCVVNFRFMI